MAISNKAVVYGTERYPVADIPAQGFMASPDKVM